MHQKIVLRNGARLLLVPLKDTQTVNLSVLFKVGSRHETNKEAGISHFIEHMMFKGTDNRPRPLMIAKELDGIGAEFNAFTGKDLTGYYIKADAKHLPLAADILSDMLLHSQFSAEELEREKGVIVEEINMYEDNPLMYVDDLLEQSIFSWPLGRSIAGSRETVRATTRRMMMTYKNKFYQPKNIVIALAGNFNARDVELIKSKFNFKGGKPLNKTKKVVTNQRQPRVKLIFKETEQTQLALGLPAYSYFDKKLYALQLLSVILGGNMSSRLFLQVRERNGLAYFIKSSLSVYEDTGALVIQSGLDKSRIEKAIRLIIGELKKIKQGVTAAELKRAKDYLAGKTVLDLEDTSHLAIFFGQQELLTNKILTPDEKINKIMAVTAAEVKKVAAEVINLNRLNLAVIGPFKDKEYFEKLIN